MIFRQLYDNETSTFTYLLADEVSREALLIDPVRENFERDRQVLDELGLQLTHTLETHVHADHVTASGLFRARLGSKSVVSKRGGASCADVLVDDGDRISFGAHALEVRATPGHTDGCVTYVLEDMSMAFTGDTLLIRGCGRTDFQQGNAEMLYESVHDKIFSLPAETKLFPGHDYKGRTMTTVCEEKQFNPRLGGGKTKEQFVAIMDALDLARPRKIDVAVPANLECGLLEEDLVEGAVVKPMSDWAPLVRTATGVPEVPTRWVAEAMNRVRVVDVREADEYVGELGHIAGAELIPLATLETAVADWDRHQSLVILCRSGGRSGRAAHILENLGFHRVVSMRGGMRAWVEEGRAVVRDQRVAG